MKKTFTLFIVALAFSLSFSLQAAVISVTPGTNVYTTCKNAVDGDIIEFSELGDYNWSSTTSLNITTPKSLTLRAAQGLNGRPVLKVTQSVTYMFFYNLGTAGGRLRFEGIEINGNNNVSCITVSKLSAGYNLNVYMDNCYVHGLASISSLTVIAFNYPNTAVNLNPDSLVIKNSMFNITGAGVMYSSGAGRPKYVVADNCWFKGSYSKGVFSNLTGAANTVKSYVLNHCTFDSNNAADLNVNNIDGDPTSTTTISNCLFTGNTGTATNYLGTGGNYKDHCGVYFTGTPNTVYKDNLMDATTLRTDPVLDSEGSATTTEYVNAGSDGKTIGYNPVRFSTGFWENKWASELSVYQQGKLLVVKGLKGKNPYRIFNIGGALIDNGTLENGVINTSRLSKGIYFLRVENKTAKFLIN